MILRLPNRRDAEAKEIAKQVCLLAMSFLIHAKCCKDPAGIVNGGAEWGHRRNALRVGGAPSTACFGNGGDAPPTALGACVQARSC